MKMDVPGYAYISGGDLNGRYVDAKGNLFRRQGNEMIADSGASIQIEKEPEPEGQLIGLESAPDPLPGGVGDERSASIAALEAEASGDAPAVAPLVAEPAPSVVSDEQVADSDEFSAKVDGLLSDLSPEELELMASKLAEEDPSVVVTQGADEAAARANARVIAARTE